jgi:glucosyl-3-phosphoglycerate synthase
VTPQEWLVARSTRSLPDDLERARRLRGDTSIAVIVPARDEEGTVAGLVRELLGCLDGLVDDVVVVDDGSQDNTAERAADAGARVVTSATCRPDVPSAGKGGALWRGLAATDSELVVFLDADVEHFPCTWVASLLLPLLIDPEIALVKAAYDRPLTVDGVAHPGSGGRVTRLVAGPLLDVVAPELTVLAQPLAGETAVRRAVLEPLSLVGGYGVELALLLDVHATVGLRGLAQVDLGERSHRHQSDEALGLMAATLVRVVADRAGWASGGDGHGTVRRSPGGGWRHRQVPVPLVQLPPLAGGAYPS